MVCYWKNWVKVDFSNFRLRNRAPNPCYWGYFLSKQEVTSCLSWLAFAALKTTTDEYLDTSIPWKMPSKWWIFRWKKCPIFCGSIFSQIFWSAVKLASLAETSSRRVKMVRFLKISLCGEAHFFRAKIAPKKVQVVLEDRKEAGSNFFCLYFVKLLGPLQATQPNFSFMLIHGSNGHFNFSILQNLKGPFGPPSCWRGVILVLG